MPQTVPKNGMRHGLIENAEGQLICPLCKEPLTEAPMVNVVTDEVDTTLLPHEVRTLHINRPQYRGIAGITIGMTCKAEHYVWLSTLILDGYVTVKTEWDEEDTAGASGRD